MAELHLICRGHKNVHVLALPIFESGYWDISPADADQLVGGTLHLHEVKSKTSYFGGVVEGWRPARTNEADTHRVVFTVRSTAAAKDVAWKGHAHAMAWSGGLV